MINRIRSKIDVRRPLYDKRKFKLGPVLGIEEIRYIEDEIAVMAYEVNRDQKFSPVLREFRYTEESF